MYICVDVCIDRVDGCVYAVKKIAKPVLGSKDEQRILREVYAHALMGVDKHVVRYVYRQNKKQKTKIKNDFRLEL